jgi:hypothetical protein
MCPASPEKDLNDAVPANDTDELSESTIEEEKYQKLYLNRPEMRPYDLMK